MRTKSFRCFHTDRDRLQPIYRRISGYQSAAVSQLDNVKIKKLRIVIIIIIKSLEVKGQNGRRRSNVEITYHSRVVKVHYPKRRSTTEGRHSRRHSGPDISGLTVADRVTNRTHAGRADGQKVRQASATPSSR